MVRRWISCCRPHAGPLSAMTTSSSSYPKAERHVDELGGPRVTLGVQRLFVDAKITRRVHAGRCDDIPAGAAVAHVVERGESPRQVVRGVVRRGRGCDETHVFRDEPQAVSRSTLDYAEGRCRRCRTSPARREEERNRTSASAILGHRGSAHARRRHGHSPVVRQDASCPVPIKNAFRCSCLVIVVPLLFSVETARRWVRWFDRPSSWNLVATSRPRRQ